MNVRLMPAPSSHHGVMTMFSARRFSLIAASLFVTFSVAADEVRFNRDVRPILSQKCFVCHGPDADTREADLRLDEEDGINTAFIGEDLGRERRLATNHVGRSRRADAAA